MVLLLLSLGLGFGFGFSFGCAAPQRSGGERTTYLAMATASGAFAAGIGSVAVCHFARYGLSHGPQTTDAKDRACLLGGALLGGAAALYGSIESEEEPYLAQWIVISLGTAASAVAVTRWLIDAMD